MADIISSVSTAISLAKRLNEIGKNIQDAEFKNLLADLSLELADVKLRLADVMGENADLKREILSLRNQSQPQKKLLAKNNMYYDESGDGPFCTGCYDIKKQLVRLVKQSEPFNELGEYKCPGCGEFFNSKI